jgi:predicted nucleotidyltransferase component of viral defense system
VIPRAFITEWRSAAPWILDTQVEHDLILSRAMVELYSSDVVRASLAFRGGTALHKLFLEYPMRFSEDIDLVQIESGPIGMVMDAVHMSLDPWLGVPRWKQGPGRVTFYYRYQSESEPVTDVRLKVKINTREHFSVMGFHGHSFAVDSRWFKGRADITTYDVNELLGTKLRALYQRKKGRDLFDLWIAYKQNKILSDHVVNCFLRYLEHNGLRVTRAELEKNLMEKLRDSAFDRDLRPLIPSGAPWDRRTAVRFVLKELAAKLPGESWKGIETE